MSRDLVTFNIQGLDTLKRLELSLKSDLLAKVNKGGLDYAAKSVPTAVSTAVRKYYPVPSARIKADIKGPYLKPESATISFSRRAPTLNQFGFKPGSKGRQRGLGQGLGWGKAKPPGKPARAKIFKDLQPRKYPTGFVLNGLPFVRNRDGSIDVLHGPSLGSMFLGSSRFGDAIREQVQARMQEQFLQGAKRALSAVERGFG